MTDQNDTPGSVSPGDVFEQAIPPPGYRPHRLTVSFLRERPDNARTLWALCRRSTDHRGAGLHPVQVSSLLNPVLYRRVGFVTAQSGGIFEPDGEPRLVFKVEFPNDMTLGGVSYVEERLNELGGCETTASGRRGWATIGSICGHVGDAGPDEWARYAVGLPEPAETRGGAMQMLEAIALEEWWTELREDLVQAGAVVDETPELDDGILE